MASQRGGARKGAGRKRKAETHAGQVARAEKRLADRLPDTLSNLERLADGVTFRTEEKQALAGTLTLVRPLRTAAGDPVLDQRGKPVMAEQPMFPDLPADAMVTVERKTVRLGPDVRANEYLANRVLGRPTETLKADLTTAGEAFQTIFYMPENGRDHAPANQAAASPARTPDGLPEHPG